ncbi:ewing's tumor-associated antigen 1 [Perca flavescens]|uniref:ewing's tumor-associated antigen 1 n=1 Tax=Perca flavescens TaxID=8167 RepID=UPI00106EF4E5|nr:uncharacterized protein LOC114571024 [Perca flavescens]
MNRGCGDINPPSGLVVTCSPQQQQAAAPSKPNRLRRSFKRTQQTQIAAELGSPKSQEPEFKTPTRIQRPRAVGGFSAESPQNDSDFQQDIIWDATSPSPNRLGKRGKKPPVGVANISEIVNRIAPKHGRPTVAEPTLQRWIGDSAAIPCTPDVQVPKPKKKSPRPSGVGDLLKLARQFDLNMFHRDEEAAEQQHQRSLELLSEDILDFENDFSSPSPPGNRPPPDDHHMEDDLDFLFDGPTQLVSGNLSQEAAFPQEASGKAASVSSPPPGVPAARQGAPPPDEFEDDWADDDFLDDSLALEMTQNPQNLVAPERCSTQKTPSPAAEVVQSAVPKVVQSGVTNNMYQRESHVSKSVQSAVPKSVQSAIPNFVQSAVPKFVQSAVSKAAQSAVYQVAQSGVTNDRYQRESPVPKAAQSAVPQVVQSAVPKAAQSAVPKFGQSAVPKVVQSAVYQVAQSGVMNNTYQRESTVSKFGQSAVPKVVQSGVTNDRYQRESPVPKAAQSAVPQVVQSAVPQVVQSAVYQVVQSGVTNSTYQRESHVSKFIQSHSAVPTAVQSAAPNVEKDNVRQRTTFRLESNPSFSVGRTQAATWANSKVDYGLKKSENGARLSSEQKTPFPRRTSVTRNDSADLRDEDLSAFSAADPAWGDPADDHLLCEMCDDLENRNRSAESVPAARAPQRAALQPSNGQLPPANRQAPPPQKQTLTPTARLHGDSGTAAGSSLAADVSATDSFRRTQARNATSSTNYDRKDQFTFKKLSNAVSTATGKVAGKCSAAEIELKKQQAMERRRQRLLAAGNLQAPT